MPTTPSPGPAGAAAAQASGAGADRTTGASRRGRRRPGRPPPAAAPTAAEFVRTVERRRGELRDSTWLRAALDVVGELHPARIRCLALGEPTQWTNAQYQLAFLQLLAEHLEVAAADVTVWDPLFAELDAEVIAEAGFRVTADDPVPAAADTLWYLPHAPMSLILAKAPQMALYLGNDVAAFEPRVPLDEEQQARLEQLRRATISPISVAKQDRWFTAMNDFALHVADPAELDFA